MGFIAAQCPNKSRLSYFPFTDLYKPQHLEQQAPLTPFLPAQTGFFS
jgi:hypothetical protein